MVNIWPIFNVRSYMDVCSCANSCWIELCFSCDWDLFQHRKSITILNHNTNVNASHFWSTVTFVLLGTFWCLKFQIHCDTSELISVILLLIEIFILIRTSHPNNAFLLGWFKIHGRPKWGCCWHFTKVSTTFLYQSIATHKAELPIGGSNFSVTPVEARNWYCG